ncbi:NAD(P)H-hydrate dehydratase [Thermodesulfatator atlanticus]|uniref:NAD(P)H-hydrate dehydratase n=1 Tax=Thermodesulfatator atlanticus TaxID=501497 RepID=UPI0003B67E67|nr:NAD(P)H-hydrate dehydratase [Thermodesulfatator atlanticus]
MLAIVGTVPAPDFPLVAAKAVLKNDRLEVDTREIQIVRGTPALIAAALLVLKHFDKEPPFVYLVGDTGEGKGSKTLYDFLCSDLPKQKFKTLVFHYLFPDVDAQGKVFMATERMPKRPFLIADAGYMYAAKAAGLAPSYDIFTPDPGELAFLADEEAPHPLYTRGFLFPDEGKVKELIERAYRHGNAAKILLVKGRVDFVVKDGKILATIDDPVVEALEPIGGTGDVITGVLAALVTVGFPPEEAAYLAAKLNRIGGKLANPTPATQVREIIAKIPEAISCLLNQK